jgi:hypothetical protein
METNALAGQNFCTTTGVFAADGGAVTTYSTTATIQYAIGGKAKTKTAVTNGATPTTGAVSAAAITLTAGFARMVVWCLDSTGTVKVVEGPITSWDGTSFGLIGQYAPAPLFPDIPDTLVPFAYMLLKGGSTLVGTWTLGSSNYNAAGLTHTEVNILVMPSRPQTS